MPQLCVKFHHSLDSGLGALLETVPQNSSFVMVGNGLSPSQFQANDFSKELGMPDFKLSVVLPSLVQLVFPENKFRVQILPEKVELTQYEHPVLPELLLDIGRSIVEAYMAQSPLPGVITGLGVNYHFVIKSNNLGMTGTNYCNQTFLANKNQLEKRLSIKDSLSSSVKLMFQKDRVRYSIDVEPHFETQGEDLHVGINAHQDINSECSIIEALDRFNSIKDYESNFPKSFFDRSE